MGADEVREDKIDIDDLDVTRLNKGRKQYQRAENKLETKQIEKEKQ